MLGLLLAWSPSVHAEQLPIKTYTTADGLVRDNVIKIVLDSRGFLWICTPDGLSRFDGHTFTNYTKAQGLPHRLVTDLLETRGGVYWVATYGGLCRFNPKASPAVRPRTGEPRAAADGSGSPAGSEPQFVVYRLSEDAKAQRVTVLLEDRAGTIWCGTDGGGLYRLERVNDQWKFHFVDLGWPGESSRNLEINALLQDRQGTLWIGTETGLYRRWPDGRTDHYTTQHGLPSNGVKTLLEDRDGRLWAGTAFGGLCRIVSEPKPNRPVVAQVYTTKDGLPHNWAGPLLQASDGRLWVGTPGGLGVFIPATTTQGPGRFQSYTMAHGLSDRAIRTLVEDHAGNLWLGSEGGVMKLVRGGLTTYIERDGLEHENISAIFESSAGDLFVVSGSDEGPFIYQFDGRRFRGIRPNVPKPIKSWGWGWIQLHFQDHTGEWWVATGQGLCRFPKVARLEDLAHTRPKAVYTTRDGLKGDNIFRLYEDSQGDLWISNINSPNEQDGVTRWQRATQTFHVYGPADAFPRSEAATAFGEDRAGNLWIGWFWGGLTRCRRGRAVRFTEKDGLSKSQIRFVYTDHAGRLWMPSGAGVVRLDDPAAEHPRFVYYTTAQGLSSDDTWSATEDRWGRIYVTTGRGVDRIDPDTGRIKHYTITEGMPRGKGISAFRDRQGVLWFGTHHWLARLVPEPDRPEAPPAVFLNGLRLAGMAHAVSELGETEVHGLELAANQNSVQIDYLGLSGNPGEPLRYQYRLEGTGEDWSPPSEQHTVHYPRLPPGSYRFAVRAVNADGLTSTKPATVAFTIPKPVWQRWWFLMLAAGLVGLLSYGLYRMRIAQVIRLEQVRTRIATDLHDDIGSSLSQVAILGEVARQQIRDAQSGSAVTVGKMADTARSLVDTMSDIVWSIDPRRDDLASLVTRVRKFASDVLEGRGIAWDLQTPPDLEKVRLSPEQRQHLYLLFKEAIHNIVRHADASAAALRIQVANHQIVAELCDNGRGFDPTFPQKPSQPVRRGYGLDSMHARAAQMGGQLRIDSAPSHGTRLTLRVPIR